MNIYIYVYTIMCILYIMCMLYISMYIYIYLHMCVQFQYTMSVSRAGSAHHPSFEVSLVGGSTHPQKNETLSQWDGFNNREKGKCSCWNFVFVVWANGFHDARNRKKAETTPEREEVPSHQSVTRVLHGLLRGELFMFQGIYIYKR